MLAAMPWAQIALLLERTASEGRPYEDLLIDALTARLKAVPSRRSLQIRAHNFDHVLRGFGRGFGLARHVIQDVVLQQLRHKAVDRAASGGHRPRRSISP